MLFFPIQNMNHHDYVRSVGYRLSGNKNYETLCPHCQHPNRRCYIDMSTGVYLCYHCGRKGKWESSPAPAPSTPTVDHTKYILRCQKDLHTSQLGRRNGLNYLINQRKLSIPIIKYAGLGYDSDKNAIVIPHSSGSNTYAVELRFINSEQRYQTLPGGKKALYNADYLAIDSPSIAVCEGVFDCLTSLQLLPTLPAVALPGNSVFDPSWKDKFKKYKYIYLLYDMSPQSEQFLEKWKEILPPYKLYRPVFPSKDLNELLVGNPDAAQLYLKAIQSAAPLGPPLVADIQASIANAVKLYTTGVSSISTGFESLDRISGGLRPGELTVLMGGSGRGKTTLATALAANLVNQNIKTLIGSFELSFDGSILPKIVSFLSRRNIEIQKLPEDKYRTVLKALDKFGNIKYLNRTGVTPIEEIIEGINQSYAEGVRFVVLDHLHYFIKADREERLHIVTAMKKLKQLTKDLPELILLLVVHPANPPKDYKTGIPQRLTMHNAKGSSDIYQESDNFWVLNYDYSAQIVDITVEKVRTDKVTIMPGGSAKVYFDKLNYQYTFL